jgi:predicted permease
MIGALQIEGDPTPPAGTTGFIDYNAIQPDYFRLMRIRLLQGTTFTDTTEAAGQVIVNEGLARKRWPGQSALGHRLRVVFNGTGKWKTIVGVAANSSTGGLLSDATEPMLYLPGNTDHDPTLILRTSGDAIPIASLRALVRSIDPTIPPPNITSVNDALAQSIAGPRFTMMLLAAFTVLALVLAAVGLYGVMSYAVAQRTREIGIRIALGASRRTIARAVVAQGVAMSVAGVIIGLVGAAWATKLVDQMLYGVARSDPLSFALGTAVLVTTALLACVVPMSRAMAVDPLIAMRAD